MTTSDYQLEFNGVILGDGTAWEIMSWDGLEQFTTRGTDVVLPTGWGAIPGSSYVEPRVVTISVESVDPSNILLLEAALLPPANASPDTLLPIRWKLPNREELLVYGRCSRRVRARDLASTFGLTRFTFELEIPDPRAYSAVLQQAALTVFVAGGSGFDLTVSSGVNLGMDLTVDSGTNLGFDFTGTSSSGLQTITNLGFVDTYPIFVFSPASGISVYSITNQTTGQVFTVSQYIPPGQTLVADMQAAATGSGALPISMNGVSVYGSWQPPRIPMRFVPGPNVLRFDVSSGDAAASVLVTAPSAYL